MRITFLFTCFFLFTELFGQTDSSSTNAHSPTYTGISVLTKPDIERLPATDFMELVHGAFPFIGKKSLIEEEYSFLVNGFIMINPNAINISQIEKITFYPAGTVLTRGNLNKKGTFIIETKPAANAFSFSTKTGLVLSRGPAASAANTPNKFLSLNELSFQRTSERSYVSSSVFYLKNSFPDQVLPGDFFSETTNGDRNRIRFSNFAGYKWSEKWKIDGGIFFTHQPFTATGKLTYVPPSAITSSDRDVTKKDQYGSAHAALTFSPGAYLNNTIIAEYNQSSIDREDGNTTVFRDGNIQTGSVEQKKQANGYSLSNQFSWQPVHSSSLAITTSLVARYRQMKNKFRGKMEETNTNGNLSFSNFSQTKENKHFSASPTVNVNIKEMLSAEIGLTYDGYENLSYWSNDGKKIFPNAGVKLNLTSLLKNTGVVLWELSSNYNEHLRNYDENDPFETVDATLTPPGPVYIIDKGAYQPSKTWLSSMTLAAWQNRFSLQLNYRQGEQPFRIYTALFNGTGVSDYKLSFERLKIKSWAVDIKTTLIEKEKSSWKLYGSMFTEKYERGNTLNSMPVDWVWFDAGKTPWRGSIRSALTLNRFFAQLSTLFAFNEYGANENSVVKPDLNTYNSNFFLVGYQLPIKSRAIKSLEINAQSKNLLQSKTYYSEKYLGIGVHVNF